MPFKSLPADPSSLSHQAPASPGAFSFPLSLLSKPFTLLSCQPHQSPRHSPLRSTPSLADALPLTRWSKPMNFVTLPFPTLNHSNPSPLPPTKTRSVPVPAASQRSSAPGPKQTSALASHAADHCRDHSARNAAPSQPASAALLRHLLHM